MDYVVGFILAALVAFIIFNFWGMSCSTKTFKQRIGYLDIRRIDFPEFHELTPEQQLAYLAEAQIIHEGFEAVTFTQHERALIWFKDPLNLYPEDFRRIVQNQTTGG